MALLVVLVMAQDLGVLANFGVVISINLGFLFACNTWAVRILEWLFSVTETTLLDSHL